VVDSPCARAKAAREAQALAKQKQAELQVIAKPVHHCQTCGGEVSGELASGSVCLKSWSQPLSPAELAAVRRLLVTDSSVVQAVEGVAKGARSTVSNSAGLVLSAGVWVALLAVCLLIVLRRFGCGVIKN
jgi:hypothetical protein